MRYQCTICRNDLDDKLCGLPCGHTFHELCLMRCIQEEMSRTKDGPCCPLCCIRVHPNHIWKLYLTALNDTDTDSDAPQMESDFREACAEIDSLRQEVLTLTETNRDLLTHFENKRLERNIVESMSNHCDHEMKKIAAQLYILMKAPKRYEDAHARVNALKVRIEKLQRGHLSLSRSHFRTAGTSYEV
jgi:FtsZ-interacting cell division protein YlmF